MDDWGYPPWQNGNLHRSWIAGASWCQLVPGVFGSPRIHPVMAPGIARASHRSSPVCARPCRTGPSLRIPRHRRRPAKAKQRTGKRPTMWGPPVISWFRFAPATIVISTTNYSDIGVIGTNLAIQRGPHIPRFSLKKLFARALDFSGSKGFGASKPSKKPLRSIKSCCNGVASDSRRGVKSEKRWTVSSSPAKPLEIPSIAALMVAESWTLSQYEPVISPEHWMLTWQWLASSGKIHKNPLLAPTRLLEGGPLEKVRGYTWNLSGAPLQGYSRALDKPDAPKPLVPPFTVARILRSI